MATQEADRRLGELFDAALTLDTGARDALLADACRDDPMLRREVEALLDAFGRARTGDVLPPLFAAADAGAPGPGARLGPYTLVRALGEGGMGVVYEAVRQDVGKRVALKLVRHGRFAAPEQLRRFLVERRVLARFEHPNIAHLLDAGATDAGLPYLVMEYVEGSPIDRHCDARRLTVEDRLALVRQVCDAVHDAHRQGVVHRDLKPSNILVTDAGVVKLLDFGIATLLREGGGDDGVPAETQRLLLTPGYAAPEQLRGEPVTAASDVYALGLLLYELLAGRRPFRRAARSPPALVRAVCEEEPEPPSAAAADTDADDATVVAAARRTHPAALRRRLRGDLDAIVLVALHKSPARRYASAQALREELDRHLAGRPVRARGTTLRYRAGKLVRRHRAATATVAALALLAGAAGLQDTFEVRRAAAERAEAARRARDVRALTGAIVRLDDAVDDVPGALAARAALVEQALRAFPGLAAADPRDAALRREIADAYVKLGLVQGGPTGANLGDLAAARASFEQALAIARALVAADPGDRAARRTLALAYEKTSDADAWSGRLPEAVTNARQALAEWRRLADALPTSVRARRAVAMSHLKLGDVLGHPNLPNAADPAGAAAQYRRALALMDGVPRDSLAGWDTRRLLALVHERLAAVLGADARHAAAAAELERALAIRDALVRERGASVEARRDLAVAHQLLCEARLADGNAAAALPRCRQALALYAALQAADPRNAQATRDLALGHQSLHHVLVARGALSPALAALARSGALSRSLLAAHPDNVAARRDLGRTLLSAALVHAALAADGVGGRAADAGRAHLRDAAAAWAEGRRLLTGLDARGWSARADAALVERARAALGRDAG